MRTHSLSGDIILMCLVAILMAGSSRASVIISSQFEPTPGLPGHRTFTLTANSDNPAQPILGFDFAGDPDDNDPATGLGIFGSLHQRNPAGLSTVYQDLNPIFPSFGWDAKQDSQFLVNSANVLSNPLASQEGPNILQAAFNFPTAQGLTVPFVQLVVPDGGRILLRGDALVGQPGASTRTRIIAASAPEFPPEVGGLNLANEVLNGEVDGILTGERVWIWGPLHFLDYTPDFGAPAGAAGLSMSADWDPDTQAFRWNTTGSTNGVFRWQVSGSNSAGSDFGIIRVEHRAVPEPSSMLLIVLAVFVFNIRVRT